VCNQVTCVYLLSPPSAVIWNRTSGCTQHGEAGTEGQRISEDVHRGRGVCHRLLMHDRYATDGVWEAQQIHRYKGEQDKNQEPVEGGATRGMTALVY
jgi:hypothetical protein